MCYEKPVVEDLGAIADHTFATPSGSHKGVDVQVGPDWMLEISYHGS